MLFVGIQSAMEYSNDRIYDFNKMNPGDFRENTRVEGSADNIQNYYLTERSPGDAVDEYYTDVPRFLGIPIGKQRHVKRYLAEVGYAEKQEDRIFCVIEFCDEEIEKADAAVENKTPVEFSGIIKDSDTINAKNNNPLINNPDSNVIPYVIYVMNTDELFNPLPAVIVGMALVLIGIAGAVALIFRIKREKENY